MGALFVMGKDSDRPGQVEKAWLSHHAQQVPGCLRQALCKRDGGHTGRTTPCRSEPRTIVYSAPPAAVHGWHPPGVLSNATAPGGSVPSFRVDAWFVQRHGGDNVCASLSVWGVK